MQILPIEQEVLNIISPILLDSDIEILRVKIFESDGSKTLQIMIDRARAEDEDDLKPKVTISDCEKLSREVSVLLDVHDPISGEFNLEVSSPGIDRPLVSFADFKRFQNYEVNLKLRFNHPELNRKKFIGKIKEINDEQQIIKLIPNDSKDQIVEIKFDEIKSAKIHLSDELLAKLM